MTISKKIINYLDKNDFKYEIIEHKTIYTAWDRAQTEGVHPKEIAKALVLKADNNYVIAIVSADKNLDKKKLLKIINSERKKQGEKNYKKIDFAKEAWMKKNIIGNVGSVPPFGNLLKLNVYVDKIILKNKKIYFGSGDYKTSIRMLSSQYLKKESPVVGSFSIKKK